MTITNFPNGISSFGVPVMGAGETIPSTTGSYFFVDSTTGLSTNDGLTSSTALATIDQAVGKCTAAKGDVIIVMPGHAENISAATSCALDVAGVSVIGLGRGRNRPVLTFTNTAGKIAVSAANVRVSNLVFFSSVSAVVVGVDVATTAADFQIDNCEFNFDATGDDFAIMLLLTTVSRAVVHGNVFIAENTAGCNAAVQFVGCTDLVISGNRFEGDYTTGVLNGVTTASTGVFVVENFLRNSDTTAGVILTTAASSTGLAAHNSGGTLYSTNITAPWANTGLLSIENYLVNVVTETAGITPAVASA